MNTERSEALNYDKRNIGADNYRGGSCNGYFQYADQQWLDSMLSPGRFRVRIFWTRRKPGGIYSRDFTSHGRTGLDVYIQNAWAGRY